MGFLLLVKNLFFFGSNLTRYLLSLFSVFVDFFTLRANFISLFLSSLDLSRSPLILDSPFFSWLALRAKSLFLFEEKPSWVLICMYTSCALIFPNNWAWWWIDQLDEAQWKCAHTYQFGEYLGFFSQRSIVLIGWVPTHWFLLEEHSNESTCY